MIKCACNVMCATGARASGGGWSGNVVDDDGDRDRVKPGQPAEPGGDLAVDPLGWCAQILVDVLDPDALPAVTYPQSEGLDWDQLEAVMRRVAQSPSLIGVSVADFRPDLDPTGELATRVVDVLDRTLP